MAQICIGRVAVVTGAGRGIGRGHALELARQGAKVVVNDLGADVHGEGPSISAAQEVVNEIVAAGGEAVVNGDDVSSEAGAERLIQTAIDTFGDIHGRHEDQVLAQLPELLRAHAIDVAVVGIGA